MGFISINNAEGYTSHSSLVLSTQAQGGIAAAINTVVYSKLNDICRVFLLLKIVKSRNLDPIFGKN